MKCFVVIVSVLLNFFFNNNIEKSIGSINDLNFLLGKSLSQAKDTKLVYNDITLCQKDTIFYSEGMDWPGISYHYNGNILFVAQSNWQDKSLISQIIVLSPRIETEDNIRVGSTIKEIFNTLKSDLPSVPDGYLMVKHKTVKNMSMEIDLSHLDNETRFRYFAKDLKSVSDTFCVASIILSNVNSN